MSWIEVSKLMRIANSVILIMSFFGLLRIFIAYFFSNVYDYKYIKFRSSHRREINNYNPSITIVIPAFNEEKSICKTIESVCKNCYQNKKIIIVNDGSVDRTSEVVQHFIDNHTDYPVTLINQPNGGKSVAINNALFNHVDTDLMMVLDADSILDKSAVKRMVEWFWNRKTLAMAMNVKMIQVPTALGLCQRFEFISSYRGKCAEHVLKTLYIVGGIGSTFRTNALKKIGGYDINTPTEDIDLTLKLLSAYGNKRYIVGYANDAFAYTQPVSKFKSLVRQRYRWKYGRFIAFVKYHHLFFNRNRGLSKTLTFLKLPNSILQELFMLIEPYVYIYLLFITIRYADWQMLLSMVCYVVVVLLLSVSSAHESIKNQCILTIIAPLNFLLSYILTIVEYSSLISSIFHIKSIINYKSNHANWNHVERM